jgi:hypothetical protein
MKDTLLTQHLNAVRRESGVGVVDFKGIVLTMELLRSNHGQRTAYQRNAVPAGGGY